jgi:hypothetical protein
MSNSLEILFLHKNLKIMYISNNVLFKVFLHFYGKYFMTNLNIIFMYHNY